jgi:hypothetical protein
MNTAITRTQSRAQTTTAATPTELIIFGYILIFIFCDATNYLIIQIIIQFLCILLKTCPVVRNTTEQLIFDPLTKKCDRAAKTPGCSVKPFFCPTTDRYNYAQNNANPNSPHSYYRCINDVPYLVVSFMQ